MRNKQIYTLYKKLEKGIDVSNIKEIYDILKEPRDDTQIIAVVHNPLLIYNRFCREQIRRH